jgi:hypothetical protein
LLQLTFRAFSTPPRSLLVLPLCIISVSYPCRLSSFPCSSSRFVPHFYFLHSSISSLTDSYFFQNACSGIRSKRARRLRRHRWYALPDRSIRSVASAASVTSPK